MALLALVVATGEKEEPAPDAIVERPSATPQATASPSPTPTPEPKRRRPRGELAIGITEPNPHFVQTRGTHQPFERWRLEMQRLRPRYYRLIVEWTVLQPRPGAPRLRVPIGGCLRDVGPCAAWRGVRDQLRALAERQRSGPGAWEALVVLSGTPEWAAEPTPCERSSTAPRSRAPRAEALYEYARVIRAVRAEAEAQGARLRYWSPWNEPNHPYFLSAQRCGPEQATEPYARMVRAMRGALAPGQELVLGELAGLYRETGESTTVREFIAALPSDLVCASRIWGQHAYIGGPDPVDDAAGALARHGCDRPHEIWITETGARTGTCDQMQERLVRWYRDRRVTAAFQYTLREDNLFRTGLVATRLGRALSGLRNWQAWGARERATDPPPRSRCPK